MMHQKIGFTNGHGESIHISAERNFMKLLKMLFTTFDKAEDITEDNSENLSEFDLIMIGAPTKPFSISFINKIRDYVHNGGKLFVLLKYKKPDEQNNLHLLFEDIKPNNDTVLNKYIGYGFRHKPIILLKDDSLHLDEKIVYDGGCTLDVGDVDLSFKLDRGYTTFKKVNLAFEDYKNEIPINKHNNTIMAFKKIGKGAVVYFGSRWTFSDEGFVISSGLMRILLNLLLDQEFFHTNVKQRMTKIQRHRLLHGFPMPDANSKIKDFSQEKKDVYAIKDESKKIALGVIAHPMCNPQIRGCGYCPFPHEGYNTERMKLSIDGIKQEIDKLKNLKLLHRKVSSIYFGGGTATLTDKSLFDELCLKMKKVLFIDKETEITLEGAPAHFVSNRELLEILKKYFPDSSLRISMGVQTFDSEILSLAGRAVMNADGSVEEAIRIAKSLGFRISADFLFNLPYRTTFDLIKKDLDKAVELGIEHICWYSLVLNSSISSPWAQNEDILKNLPSKEQALDNWLKLYKCLKEYGYEAVTVTDFKKKGSPEGHYQYEEDLRVPDQVDWIGLGSYGISLLTSNNFKNGIKLINYNDLNEYVEGINQQKLGWGSAFKMNEYDLKLYWITRKIKGTVISANEYDKIFNSAIEDEFKKELKALLDFELLELRDQHYHLTPKGFFYADTVAGHFAWQRVNELRGIRTPGKLIKKGRYGDKDYSDKEFEWNNDSVKHFMG